MIRRIAVLTGDDKIPGMNAVIRAVTRTALHNGWEVMGVCDGFTGLVAGEFIPLTARTVDGIIRSGGTMLGSIDSKAFSTEAGQRFALDQLSKHEIDALVVVGDHEAQAGAYALSQLGFPVNGVAASIENRPAGFDMPIGVDTAVNVALDSVDRLKQTRSEDGEAYIVEVAGYKSGYLALLVGIASGADMIVIPEAETKPEQIADAIKAAYEAGKAHPVVVVAEGAVYNAERLHRYFAKNDLLGRRLQEMRLGYLQRRAAPSAFDRVLGARLGACAVDALARGEYGVLAGSPQGAMRTTPLAEVVGETSDLDVDLIHLADSLSMSNCSVVQSP